MRRTRNWRITVNNYKPTDRNTLKNLEIIRYGIAGYEIAPETGTPHIQGYIQTHNPYTRSALQKNLQKAGIACWCGYADATEVRNTIYCSKEGDFIKWGTPLAQGQRTDIEGMLQLVAEGKSEIDIADAMPKVWAKYYKAAERYKMLYRAKEANELNKTKFEEASLRDWQKDCVDKLEEQDNRKVLWIYDSIGNNGKSFLGEYLHAKKGAFSISGGKKCDIAYAYDYEEYIVFDFARQQETIINYSLIEDFKNGKIFSPKYTSCTKRFRPAKVIIFSNFYPDTTKLSEDRWEIVDLNSL